MDGWALGFSFEGRGWSYIEFGNNQVGAPAGGLGGWVLSVGPLRVCMVLGGSIHTFNGPTLELFVDNHAGP